VLCVCVCLVCVCGWVDGWNCFLCFKMGVGGGEGERWEGEDVFVTFLSVTLGVCAM
jgi:hypothetical protein